jgi:hypothetical protein
MICEKKFDFTSINLLIFYCYGLGEGVLRSKTFDFFFSCTMINTKKEDNFVEFTV